ncbi:MAG: hypothetical protein ACI9DJ_001935 [Algoriphagus sp.]|jgi:hypothetical protein
MIYLAILIFAAILSVLGPWWIAAPVAFIACRLKAKSNKQAFWSSSLALFTLWLAYAIYIQLASEVDMVHKMAGVLTSSVDGISPIGNIGLIFGLTAILSLVVGGISGIAGYKLKQI